jgi:hypothetical protein
MMMIASYSSSSSSIIMATAFVIVGYLSSSTFAFHIIVPTTAVNFRSSSSRLTMIGRESNVDLSGNAWKPDSEKMGVRCVFDNVYIKMYRTC